MMPLSSAPSLGLSSNSVPELSGIEIVNLIAALGLTCVDLRHGRDQGWETDGLEVFERAAVRVGFVGFDFRLGEKFADPEFIDTVPERLCAATTPVKVFAVPNVDSARRRATARAQIATLARTRGSQNVFVETHRGGPPLSTLLDLADATGIRIVIDNLGLVESHSENALPDTGPDPRIAGAQVKGFKSKNPQAGHLALAEADQRLLSRIRSMVPDGGFITIESRFGQIADDSNLLSTLVAR